MFDWLRKLFRKKEVKREDLSRIDSGEVERRKALIEEKPKREWKADPALTMVLRKGSDFRPEYQRIVQKNLERQRNTLGYGLKSRNFKPRPAHEKRLWKLNKKPSVEEGD